VVNGSNADQQQGRDDGPEKAADIADVDRDDRNVHAFIFGEVCH
jgi:hypothetical protein